MADVAPAHRRAAARDMVARIGHRRAGRTRASGSPANRPEQSPPTSTRSASPGHGRRTGEILIGIGTRAEEIAVRRVERAVR